MFTVCYLRFAILTSCQFIRLEPIMPAYNCEHEYGRSIECNASIKAQIASMSNKTYNYMNTCSAQDGEISVNL